jgi:exonuclease SbcD
MRLVHTSDWHLGRQTYGHSRAADHDAVIDEIVSITKDYRPHLILHTGDVWDTARPHEADAQRGVEGLQRLADIAPVVVLCGNHDGPATFRLYQTLQGRSARITFVDVVRAPEDGGILEFEGDRDERIRLAPFPFLTANRAIDPFNDGRTWMATYADRVGQVEALLGEGLMRGYSPMRDVLLFAAHLNVAGARYSSTEREVHIRADYATRVETIPPVSYAAFGHIHKHQKLAGTLTGYYAGSPMQLDFGEEGEHKYLVTIEARPGRSAVIETPELTSPRRLVRLEGTLDDVASHAAEVGRNLALVTVISDTTIPGLADEVRLRLPEAEILDVIPRARDRELAVVDVDLPDDAEPGMRELFRAYVAKKSTRKASAELVVETFNSVLAAVQSQELPHFEESDALQSSVQEAPPEADATQSADGTQAELVEEVTA